MSKQRSHGAIAATNPEVAGRRSGRTSFRTEVLLGTGSAAKVGAMRDRAFTLLTTFVFALILSAPTLADAQRVDLPRPDSSRAPLLTRTSPDSIRYQTAYLHVSELLQALQAGDAKTMSMLFENATLGSASCGSVGEAVSRSTSRARRITLLGGGTVMALFFDKIKIADSGAAQVVTADLVMVPATSSEPVRSPVELVLDAATGVWKSEGGLLDALCQL